MPIDVGIEKSKTMEIQKLNNTLLEMAIVVGSGFTLPSRKKIGDEFLFYSFVQTSTY